MVLALDLQLNPYLALPWEEVALDSSGASQKHPGSRSFSVLGSGVWRNRSHQGSSLGLGLATFIPNSVCRFSLATMVFGLLGAISIPQNDGNSN